MKMNPYAIRQYIASHDNSWGVFHRKDLRGLGRIIHEGEAQPIAFGLTKAAANSKASALADQHQRMKTATHYPEIELNRRNQK